MLVEKVKKVSQDDGSREIYRYWGDEVTARSNAYGVAIPGAKESIYVYFQDDSDEDPGVPLALTDCDLLEIVRDRIKCSDSTKANSLALSFVEGAIDCLNELTKIKGRFDFTGHIEE